MKQKCGIAALVFCIIFPSALSLSAGTKDGLVAHYTFDGTNRDVTDNSKSAQVERIQTTSDRHGNAGRAYQFVRGEGLGGSVAYLPVNISPSKMKTATVAGWFKATATERSQVWYTKRQSGRGLFVHYDDGKTRWAAMAGNEDPVLGPVVLKDQWTFIAIMYDDGAKEAILVVNDRAYRGDAKGLAAGEQILVGGNSFIGAVSDMRIYNCALSKADLEGLSGQPLGNSEAELTFTQPKAYKPVDDIYIVYGFHFLRRTRTLSYYTSLLNDQLNYSTANCDEDTGTGEDA
jgi:hypothetical protein